MKYKNIKLVSVVVLAAMALVSCSDSFLEEKKNYEQARPVLPLYMRHWLV